MLASASTGAGGRCAALCHLFDKAISMNNGSPCASISLNDLPGMAATIARHKPGRLPRAYGRHYGHIYEDIDIEGGDGA